MNDAHPVSQKYPFDTPPRRGSHIVHSTNLPRARQNRESGGGCYWTCKGLSGALVETPVPATSRANVILYDQESKFAVIERVSVSHLVT